MKRIIHFIVTAAIMVLTLGACKKEQQTNPDAQSETNIKQLAAIVRGHVLVGDMPDGEGPCVPGPADCEEPELPAVTSNFRLRGFTASVINGTYMDWLGDPVNYQLLADALPLYTSYFQDCIHGQKMMVYHAPSGSSRCAVLIGNTGATTVQHHDLAIVLTK